MIRWLLGALDDRLGSSSFLRVALRKAFPDHWSFMLGELAAYCFIFIVASGTYLTFFFHPSDATVIYHGPVKSLDGRSMTEGYASVLQLSFQTQVGLLIRQAHHWCADVFVAAIVVHMSRIFFTGAFRKPREINWLIGLTMLLLVMGDGFTGYSLPGDNLSGAGLRIADSIALSIPIVGSWIAYLLFGGTFPTHDVTSRLFPIHVLFIPAAIAALLTAHVMILWHQKHTQFPGRRRTEHNVVGSPLFPTYAVKSLALMMATFGVLLLMGGLIEINPVWEYGPYDPWTLASPAQPDWYIGWLEGALRLAPRWAVRFGNHSIGAPFWPGVVLPGIIFFVLYCWPLIENVFTRDRAEHELLQFPWQNPGRVAFGTWIATFMALLLGAGSDDVQARLWQI
ncbi:MAG: cytochrome b, partial [Candidatus Eremiobacteraeota bacterium]|nr:cytochrome b [Candidatus Eremiobacteraeota bacterium]